LDVGRTLVSLQAIDAGVTVNAIKAGDRTSTSFCVDVTVVGKMWSTRAWLRASSRAPARSPTASALRDEGGGTSRPFTDSRTALDAADGSIAGHGRGPDPTRRPAGVARRVKGDRTRLFGMCCEGRAGNPNAAVASARAARAASLTSWVGGSVSPPKPAGARRSALHASGRWWPRRRRLTATSFISYPLLMPGLESPWHWLVLVAVLLLLFGAKRLPEMGRSLGTGMREFKRSVTGIVDDEASADPEPPMLARAEEAPSPAPTHAERDTLS